MFTFKETLQFLNISESTLYRMMARGELRGYRVSRCWRFKQHEVESYLVSHASTQHDKVLA